MQVDPHQKQGTTRVRHDRYEKDADNKVRACKKLPYSAKSTCQKTKAELSTLQESKVVIELSKLRKDHTLEPEYGPRCFS